MVTNLEKGGKKKNRKGDGEEEVTEYPESWKREGDCSHAKEQLWEERK